MFKNAMQLKGWIKNKTKQTGIHANILLQNYMMERFLERVSLSPYRNNIILKGGFLIAAMVGVEKRSTMDIDTTVKGLSINRENIDKIMREIISINIDDGISFIILDIENIHDISEYDDFRVSMLAVFKTIHVDMKIDITTGDSVIPSEIEFPYKLMFEERIISVKAYNLNTILAEKIETILSRGIANTRGRDFYDVYLLLSMHKNTLDRSDLLNAVKIKATERSSISAIENHTKILNEISKSPDIAKIWSAYVKNYSCAEDISLQDVLSLISYVFEG